MTSRRVLLRNFRFALLTRHNSQVIQSIRILGVRGKRMLLMVLYRLLIHYMGRDHSRMVTQMCLGPYAFRNLPDPSSGDQRLHSGYY